MPITIASEKARDLVGEIKELEAKASELETIRATIHVNFVVVKTWGIQLEADDSLSTNQLFMRLMREIKSQHMPSDLQPQKPNA